MGRKKKKPSKPWCWYCNREFDDEKILIQHQKAKHFKCHICHKKLYTGPGLAIHCMQVHKDAIDKIPNALPNRSNVDIEIYGMEGMPEADLREHERTKGVPEPSYPEPSKLSTPKPPVLPVPGMMPLGYMPNQGVNAPYMGSLMPTPNMQYPVPPNHYPQMHPLPMPPSMYPNSAVPPPIPTNPPMQSNVSSSLSGPPNIISSNVAPKPLFPSVSSSIPAPSASSSISSSSSKIITITATTRIIHPEEDLSLEELRTRLPRYKHLNLSTGYTTPPSQQLQPPQPLNGANPTIYSNVPTSLPMPHHQIPPSQLIPPHLMPHPPMHSAPPPFQQTFQPSY